MQRWSTGRGWRRFIRRRSGCDLALVAVPRLSQRVLSNVLDSPHQVCHLVAHKADLFNGRAALHCRGGAGGEEEEVSHLRCLILDSCREHGLELFGGNQTAPARSPAPTVPASRRPAGTARCSAASGRVGRPPSRSPRSRSPTSSRAKTSSRTRSPAAGWWRACHSVTQRTSVRGHRPHDLPHPAAERRNALAPRGLLRC